MIHITYFVHGSTPDNERNISSGWHYISLSELGIQQSLDLRKILRSRHFDIVFCSDLKRAIDTTSFDILR